MAGIGSYWLELLLMAQKAIQMHEPQHTLVVNRIAAILEFCRNPSIAIAGKFQSDILNLVSENAYSVFSDRWLLLALFAICSSRCDLHPIPGRIGIWTTEGCSNELPG